MKLQHFFIIGLIGSAVSGQLGAQVFSVTQDVPIPDDAYDGSLPSMASVELNVPVSTNILDVNVTLSIDHTWIGDLVIKLKSPAGTLVTLMSRPGYLETVDDGNNDFFGRPVNLSSDYPVTFDEDGVVSAEAMGATLPTGDDVVCKDDGECDFIPDPGAAAPGDLSSFNGQNALGTWILYIGDSGPDDRGTNHTFTLTFNSTIPAVRLVISRTNENVVLTWPTNPPDYLLESAQPHLTNGWATIMDSPMVNGTKFTTTLPATNTSRFFRLRKP